MKMNLSQLLGDQNNEKGTVIFSLFCVELTEGGVWKAVDRVGDWLHHKERTQQKYYIMERYNSPTRKMIVWNRRDLQ